MISHNNLSSRMKRRRISKGTPVTATHSFFLSLILLVLAFLTLAGCNKNESSAVESRGKPVRVETIGRGDIKDFIVYPATLHPYNEVRIFSVIPDQILEFPWNDGDEIRRGERVALIKRGGMDQGLANMSAQVEGLDIQIANLESELERTRELLSAGAVAQAAFDRLDTQLRSLQSQRKALLAARSQLAVQAGNASITAPISGVIAGKALEKGDMAIPQVPLCRILGIDQLKVDIRLIESDVPRVFVGQDVRLHLDAYPNRPFQGKITTILPYLDPATRTNTVEVTLDNPLDKETNQRPLKPGMFGRAEIVVSTQENVLLAPEPALLLDNEILASQQPGEILRKAMVVDDKNIAHQRVVRCGTRRGSYYEVLEGLKEGDRIVVRGQQALQDGDLVEVMDSPQSNQSNQSNRSKGKQP